MLGVAFLSQLILPFAIGTSRVEVNLTDSLLQGTEVLLIVLTLVWLYISIREYLFTARMGKQIKEARKQEHEITQKYGLPEGELEV